jgi:hypothetical protein
MPQLARLPSEDFKGGRQNRSGNLVNMESAEALYGGSKSRFVSVTLIRFTVSCRAYEEAPDNRRSDTITYPKP